VSTHRAYRLFKTLFGPLVWCWSRPRVHGREHLPRTGAAILALNHLAEIDSLCVALALPRPVTFVAKSEYFVRGGIVGRAVATVLRVAGQIPLDRSGGEVSQRGLDAAHRILDAGGVWAIYPEGTRSPDGRLHRGHTGLMRVALGRVCPVLPITLAGTERIRPWRPARVEIVIGPPVDLSAFARDPDDHAAVRAATDHLMVVLQRQGGLQYVDRYARPASRSA
jgi:1-acyl-sn-glycerol-3-phosphate acyltransferase